MTMRKAGQYLYRTGWWALVALLVGGCSLLPAHKDDFAKINDDFMLRMRWHDISGAAQHFAAKEQEPFLERFEAWDDLKVTALDDTRGETLDEPGVAVRKVHYLLEYYVMPSVTVRQKRFTLRWEKMENAGVWLIAEPFPTLD